MLDPVVLLPFGLSGMALYIGLYHLYTYRVSRDFKEQLWYSMASLVVSAYGVASGFYNAAGSLGDVWLWQGAKICLAVPLLYAMVRFVSEFYRLQNRRARLLGYAYLAHALVLPLVAWPGLTRPDAPAGSVANLRRAGFEMLGPGVMASYAWSFLMILWMLVLIIRQLRAGREFASIFLVSVVAIVLIAANDMLFLTPVYLAEYGYLGFVVLMALVFVRRYEGMLKETHAAYEEVFAQRERAERARKRAEATRREVEKLNEFSRKLNSSADRDSVLFQIFDYILDQFDVTSVWLLLVDPEKNELYSEKIRNRAQEYPEKTFQFLQNTRVSLNRYTNVLAAICHRGKPTLFRSRAPGAMSETDRRIYEELQVQAFLAVPLVIGGKVIGLVCLMKYRDVLSLTREETAAIYRFCDQVAGTVHMMRLYRNLERSWGELRSEIALAKKIQESLLPGELPDVPRVQLAYKYAPMLDIGGDFIDLRYEADSNILGFFICDVSGHGVPAALLSSMVKMSLQNWSEHIRDPAEMIRRIHGSLRGKTAGNFISACVGVLNLEDGELVMAQAGHPSPVILRVDGTAETARMPGRVLMDNPLFQPDWENRVMRLQPGEALILYTDGLIEARDGAERMLGEDGLIEMIRTRGESAPAELCAEVYRSVRAFAGGETSVDDDFTILALKYLGA